MERMSKKIRLLGKTAMAALLFLGFALGPAWAGSIVVDGIKVTYPYAFDAYYDSNDRTLTIAIYEEGGGAQRKGPEMGIFLLGFCGCVLVGELCLRALHHLQGELLCPVLHNRPGG